jgi:hypothetical protein
MDVPWVAVDLEVPEPLMQVLRAEAGQFDVSLSVVVAARLCGRAADGSTGDRL